MESQKFINLLGESDDDNILIFATRKWYIVKEKVMKMN